MSECNDPKCACHQLAWMEEMERIEQEVFPDARPRSEVVVQVASSSEPDSSVTASNGTTDPASGSGTPSEDT